MEEKIGPLSSSYTGTPHHHQGKLSEGQALVL